MYATSARHRARRAHYHESDVSELRERQPRLRGRLRAAAPRFRGPPAGRSSGAVAPPTWRRVGAGRSCSVRSGDSEPGSRSPAASGEHRGGILAALPCCPRISSPPRGARRQPGRRRSRPSSRPVCAGPRLPWERNARLRMPPSRRRPPRRALRRPFPASSSSRRSGTVARPRVPPGVGHPGQPGAHRMPTDGRRPTRAAVPPQRLATAPANLGATTAVRRA